MMLTLIQGNPTVDGQNPAPPRMMIIPLFIGFGGAGFRPSTVSMEFPGFLNRWDR